jgi:hypothetical protein
MLSSGSGDQLCSPPAVLLWNSLCLFAGDLFLCLVPFLWGKVSDPSAGPCCQHVVMVHCLFFNFAELFVFGCCSLAQWMSFLVCYLPYFRQWLITCPLLAFLPFQLFVY